jgi:hypothetical protein
MGNIESGCLIHGLADVHGFNRRKDIRICVDQVSQARENGRTILCGHSGPSRMNESLLPGRYGTIHILSRSAGHVRQQLASAGIQHFKSFAMGGILPTATYEQLMRLG